jgi:hypothetical protein
MSLVAREFVNYDGPYGPNAIVINTDERRLNYIYRNVTDTHRAQSTAAPLGPARQVCIRSDSMS